MHPQQLLGFGAYLVHETREHGTAHLEDLVHLDTGDLAEEILASPLDGVPARVPGELEAEGAQAPAEDLGVLHEAVPPRFEGEWEDRCARDERAVEIEESSTRHGLHGIASLGMCGEAGRPPWDRPGIGPGAGCTHRDFRTLARRPRRAQAVDEPDDHPYLASRRGGLASPSHRATGGRGDGCRCTR